MTISDLICPSCDAPVRLIERASRKAGKLIYACRECDRRYSLGDEETLEAVESELEDSDRRTLRMRSPQASGDMVARLTELRAPSTTGSLPEGIRLTLEFIDGPHRGHTVPVVRTRSVVGRLHGEIQLRDPLVSRRHALVEIYDPETIILKDLSSTNGTWHNGRLIDHCKLRDGDEVRLGLSLFNVVIDRAT